MTTDPTLAPVQLRYTKSRLGVAESCTGAVPELKRVFLVAGEASGDILGADLIRALQEQNPDIIFEGVAGPRMMAAGCSTLFPMEKLSVMGFWEPLKHLPELLKCRRKIVDTVLKNKPDIFIGIDSPDFNLPLEEKFKKAGIKTVHYVSPSVWAWRRYRIHQIKRAVDLMLTLFPFETKFYETHHVPVKFVGHPLADQISLEPNRALAREQLQLQSDQTILAIMPGSRAMELNHLVKPFIETAQYCLKQMPNLQIVTSMANANRREQFENLLQRIAPNLPIKIFDQKTHEILAASDAALLTSGTVTLEAMLLKCPMVVAYRMNTFNYWIAKRLVKIDYFSLPNLIAGKTIVPEFLQDEVVPEKMGDVLLQQLQNSQETQETFLQLHRLLKCDAGREAVKAIFKALSPK